MFKRSLGSVMAARSEYRQVLVDAMNVFFGAIESRRTGRIRWTPWATVTCTVLMCWDSSPSLKDRFRAARDVLDGALSRRRRVGRTYQGLVQALRRLGTPLFQEVPAHLRVAMQSIAGKHWTRCGLVAMAVDGTRIDCPRTRANKAFFSTTGKNNSGPQVLMTTVWHMGTGLPWAWRIGRLCEGERQQLLDLMDVLPPNALIVADAGYTGFEYLSSMAAQGKSFLIRVGASTTLLQELGWYRFEGPDTVYLWPGWPHRVRDQAPLTLRLVRLEPQGCEHPVFLITNVLDADRLSVTTAQTLYEMRWGVEVFFRDLKQTLARRKMRSGVPRRVICELHWSMVGLMLLGMLPVKQMIDRNQDPLLLSVAEALRTVRQQMRRASGTVRQLLGCLGRAVKDQYERKGPKHIQRWPRKRDSRPPGNPTVRAPNESELRRLKRLLERTASP